MTDGKRKSFIAKKNEGNSLFFSVLYNVLTGKSDETYAAHVDDPTFDDVYTAVGVEKALGKCLDPNVIVALAECQSVVNRMQDIRHHYWFLMKRLPRTSKSIDWRQNG